MTARRAVVGNSKKAGSSEKTAMILRGEVGGHGANEHEVVHRKPFTHHKTNTEKRKPLLLGSLRTSDS
jgi:hypothetical protein